MDQNRVPPRAAKLRGRGYHLVRGDRIDDSTTPPRFPTIRVNLLHAHGSPTGYLYRYNGCRCAACRAANTDAQRQYRTENPECDRLYCAGHSEERAEYNRRRHAEHPEYRRKYNAEHAEERAEYNRKYRAEHPAELAEYKRKYRAEHPEEEAERDRKYHAEDPEEYAANSRNRRAREANATGTHSAADVRAQYERQRGICFWCPVKVGDTYHVDHVVPLILGGSNGPENLVIACPTCNHKKHAKHPMDFAGILC